MGAKSSKPPGVAKRSVTPDPVPKLWDEDVEASRTDQTVVAPKSARSVGRPALVVMAGGSAGRVLRFESDKVVVGRSKHADLTLTDEGVSRKHCEIARHGLGYWLTDNGSTNGTFVNGGKVRRVALRPGDRVQLGPEAVFQFVIYDAAEEGLAKKLYEAATRDPLTGTLNRQAFQERLAAELAFAARHKENLVAVCIDIDHFKAINDGHGHAGGDAVLRGLAKVVGTTLRSEDVFARMGGEEFVVLGRGLNLESGVKMAERIRKVVADHPFEFKGRLVPVTISAGVAELGETQAPPAAEKLLELADQRLYVAKREGRNRVVAQ